TSRDLFSFVLQFVYLFTLDSHILRISPKRSSFRKKKVKRMIIFEKAPAKLNLSLDVISKRDDGYHNVEMVSTTIDLYDRIGLQELEENKIEISLESRYVPSDERNLAFKAARLFKEAYNIGKGIHIDIEKSIPVSAGLGGGSADAAAVLRG